MRTAFLCLNPLDFLCEDAKEVLFEQIEVSHVDMARQSVRIIKKGRFVDFITLGLIYKELFQSEQIGIEYYKELKEKIHDEIRTH